VDVEARQLDGLGVQDAVASKSAMKKKDDRHENAKDRPVAGGEV
jgi:hypothetical protein